MLLNLFVSSEVRSDRVLRAASSFTTESSSLIRIARVVKTTRSKAITIAEKIYTIDSKSARWIATDALRELKSEKVQKRLNTREKT